MLIHKNIRLITAGEMSRGIYVLVKGQAQLISNDEGVRRLEPNEILGLTETIDHLPFEMSIVTITLCRFEFIEREDFFRFLRDEPEVCFRLAQMLALNLQKSYQLLRSSIV
jgi:CRP-like cAMP-binding protein